MSISKPVALAVAVRQRHPAVELDLGLVDRVARVRIEDLVAGVHQGEEELADHGLAAGLDGDVLRLVEPCEAPTSAARPREARDAGVGAVAGLAVAMALNAASTMLGGVAGSCRRGGTDRPCFRRREGGGLGGDGEGRLGPEGEMRSAILTRATAVIAPPSPPAARRTAGRAPAPR